MTVPRAEARAVRLRTGDVLLVGGTAITKENPVLTAELYHPSSGTFTSVGASHLTDETQVVLLNDGKALVVGSSGSDLYDHLQRTSPSAGAMTLLGSKFSGASVNHTCFFTSGCNRAQLSS